MKNILMLTAALTCAAPLDLAVQEFENASPIVREAFYEDNCPGDELVQLDTGFQKLNATDRTAYEVIDAALSKAYAQVPATDGELMEVNVQFCLAIEEGR